MLNIYIWHVILLLAYWYLLMFMGYLVSPETYFSITKENEKFKWYESILVLPIAVGFYFRKDFYGLAFISMIFAVWLLLMAFILVKIEEFVGLI